MVINPNSTSYEKKSIGYAPAAAIVAATGAISGTVGYLNAKPKLEVLKDTFINFAGSEKKGLAIMERFKSEGVNAKEYSKLTNYLSEQLEVVLQSIKAEPNSDIPQQLNFFKDVKRIVVHEKLKTAGIWAAVGAAVAGIGVVAYNMYNSKQDNQKQA